MTNEELHDKIHDTNLAVVRIEGEIKNLATSINAHITATGKIEDRIDTIDKRIWGALVSGIGSLLSIVFHWTVKR